MRRTVRALVVVCALGTPASTQETVVLPDDPAIRYTEHVDSVIDSAHAAFDRWAVPLFGADHSPGTRVNFRSDATSIRFGVDYRYACFLSGCGLFRLEVDGVLQPELLGSDEALDVQWYDLWSQPSPAPHDFSLVFPYGTDVDFLGLALQGGTAGLLWPPPPRPAPLVVAYGDSITHGYAGSSVGATWPHLFGASEGARVINFGFVGHVATAEDGTTVGELGGDRVVAMIGVNDYRKDTPAAEFVTELSGFLDGLRAVQPEVPVVLVTMTWVAYGAIPNAEGLVLEDYRELVRQIVAERAPADPRLRILEGEEIAAGNGTNFVDGLHPSDAGLAEMAAAIAEDDLVRDGGLELGGIGWTLEGASAVATDAAHGGASALAIGPAAGTARQPLWGIAPETCWTLSAFALAEAAAEPATVEVAFLDAGGLEVATHAAAVAGAEWSELAIPFTAPSGFARVELRATKADGAALARFDDLELIEADIGVALAYGCGANVPESLVVLSGSPSPGAELVLGIDDPTGSFPPGASTLVIVAEAPAPEGPCGTPFPGYGLSPLGGEAELSVDAFAPTTAYVLGATWSGSPAPVSLAIPPDCALLGTSAWAQGVLVDGAAVEGTGVALTGALELRIGR